MAKPKRRPRGTTFLCVRCAGPTLVYLTRQARHGPRGHITYRRRRCKDCGCRFTTLERFVVYERQRQRASAVPGELKVVHR